MQATSSPRTTQRVVLRLILLSLCITAVAYPRGREGLHSVRVAPGWNLLSLSASVSNGSRALLFPSAVSPAYIFQYPGGYVPQDTLQNGMGFWLKFASVDTVLIQGETVFKDTVEVQAGWNIIGPLSVPLATPSVVTEPPGIVVSQFFRYMPGGGYQPDTLLQPGLGYWVKVSQDGSMILASPGGQPCPGMPIVDFAGKIYNTVLIGTQCWLRENLDVGTMVLGTQEQADNDTIEKYCYDNNSANCDTFGGLYQWNEAMQYGTTQSVQGVCPPGWHIPTLGEFDTLSATVGGDGNALKAIGQGTGGGAGTNTSGFSALLAGYRHNSGNFANLGDNAHIGSSTQSDVMLADLLGMEYFSTTVYLHSYFKDHGFSVRCLKD